MDIIKQKQLSQSPMFQLSLSSKELFHSNFIYWLGVNYTDILNSVLQKVCKDDSLDISHLHLYREKDNFDLSWWNVTGDKKEEVKIIVENKIKSIPNKNQLDRYMQKGEYHVLLSLVRDFPNRDLIEKCWKIIHYDDLANALIEQIRNNAIADDYHQNLIKDYCQSIKLLSDEVNERKLEYSSSFLPDSKQSRELRINDLKEKLRFSQMAIKLSHKLQKKGFEPMHDVYRDEMFSAKFKPSPKAVFINFGMTRSLGLLEIKVKASENLAYVVQIQGEQYRHALELYNTQNNENANWAKFAVAAQRSWFLRINPDDKPFNLVGKLDDSEIEIYPIKNSKNKVFNKYGSEFLYQSVKIQKNMTVDDVLESIVNDCVCIRSYIESHS